MNLLNANSLTHIINITKKQNADNAYIRVQVYIRVIVEYIGITKILKNKLGRYPEILLTEKFLLTTLVFI